MRTVSLFSAFTAATLSLGTASLHAQSATIQATATVLSAITVTGTNLAFGNVTPGVAKTVVITDAGAGQFTVTKAAATSVALTFTLPATLAGPAASTMPIGTWTAGWNNTANNAAGATSFTPSAAATTVPSGGASLWVWVGGTVTPGGAQTAGAYTGNVSMQVAYL